MCELGDCGEQVGAHPRSVIEKRWHNVFVSMYVLYTHLPPPASFFFSSVEGRPTVVVISCPNTFCASSPWVVDVDMSDKLRRPYGSYSLLSVNILFATLPHLALATNRGFLLPPMV